MTVTAATYAGYVGGAWVAQFTITDCIPSDPRGTKDGYAIAQDMTSGCYSEKLPVDFCYNL